MRKSAIAVAALLLTGTVTPALACECDCGTSHINALKDRARAEEKQADSLRRLERIEHDRNKMIDREIRRRR